MKRNKARPETKTENGWPRLVKVGGTAVRVYRQTRANGTPGYYVADYSSGTRRMRSFPTEETALVEAKRLAVLLAAGEAHAAQVSGKDIASLGRALEHLRPSGVSIELATATFAKAFAILGSDRILEAAEFFRRNTTENLPARTVAEVVSELVDVRTKRGSSADYIADLRVRLAKFAAAFACPISSVTTGDVQAWLDALRLSPRTVKNFRTNASTLFGFAEARGYIRTGANPVDGTEAIKSRNGSKVEIFTPAEISKLLAAAPADFVPLLAIGAFAGVRVAEILRLDWGNVDLAGGFITVAADKAKTARRRLVPISDNLRQWLAPYAQPEGKLWNLSDCMFSERSAATAAKARVDWKANGLRHSFISYRVAQVQNVAQVALEAGNSARVIFSNYRELVRPADAVKWFAIAPEAPGNVVSLNQAVA